MEAAGEMTDQDRAAMIEGMVAGLAERLQAEGGAPAEWARLIRAYGVLGRAEEAAAAYARAREAHAGDAAAEAEIEAAARAAGLAP